MPRSRRTPPLHLLALVTVLVCVSAALYPLLRTPANLPDVLLIVLDTTRADRLSLHGYPRPTTPILRELGERSVVFRRAFATSPWTIPSHASLFTGKMPGELGVGWHNLRLPEGIPTLAEVFRSAGYRTVAFFQNPILEEPSFARGFSTWQKTGVGKAASELAPFLRSLSAEEPVFLFLNLFAPHLAYNPAPEHRSLFVREWSPRVRRLAHARWHTLLERYWSGNLSREDIGILGDLYDGELHWADTELGQVFALWNETGRRRPLVVAVTADHGESLGEKGLFDHQLSVSNTLLHVPLVLYAPGRLAPATVSRPVSLRDLPRTLLELAGNRHARSFPGRSLVERAVHDGGGVVVSEYELPAVVLDELRTEVPSFDVEPFRRGLVAVQNERFKLVVPTAGKMELYDLQKDPEESRDLYPPPPGSEAARALRILLAAVEAESGTETHRTPVLSPEDLERLQTLGYLPGP
ncbi:MAG: hypothetical protein KatS3mg076_2282 [Candidatus Binatia bacterium]|nr:MAG: hypothetical protein KatS3mg076_2282 [Candidatus Binatia bacterium]